MKNFVKRSWQEGTQIGNANAIAAVIFGGSSHSTLYLVYKYNFGLWENFYLRALVTFMCVSFIFYPFSSKKIQQKIFPFYWHLMLIMALPLIFTVNLLQNNFHEVWLYWELFGVLLMAMLVPNWFMYLFDLVVGFFAAFLFCFFVYGINFSEPHFNVTAYLICIISTAVMGVGFTCCSRAVWLARLYKELLSLSGSIIHEVRNPLNVINIAAMNLKNAQLNQKDSKNVETIIEALNQANQIINLALSDLQNKPLQEQDFVTLNVNEILLEVVKDYGYLSDVERRAVKLASSVSEQSFVLKVVPERLKFVIYNLLKNALYYLREYPNSLVTIGTEVKVIQGKSWNVIYIHDTGPGIAPENLARLFEDFYTSNKKEGTGLGLAFCKRNMKAFGGDIICESEFGNGKSGWTKFSLLFPEVENGAARQELNGKNSDKCQAKSGTDLKELQTSSERENKAEVERKDESVKNKLESLRDKKILIADDHHLNRKTIQGWLSYYGCEVDAATNGGELLKIYKDSLDENGISKFDLIITDFSMPIKNGDEIVQEIRSLEKRNAVSSRNKIPIIIVSGNGDKETLEKLLEPNLTSYFIKGSDLNSLLKIVLNFSLNGD